MLFLGMKRRIFLIKESWQVNVLQYSPGLAQNLRHQGHKHLIFRFLPGKDERGHISLVMLSNLQHHSGSQVFSLTFSRWQKSKVKQCDLANTGYWSRVCDFFHSYGDTRLAGNLLQGQSVSRSLAKKKKKKKEMPSFQFSLFQRSRMLTRKYEYHLYFCYSCNTHIDFSIYIIMLTVATYKIIAII